MYNNAHGTMLGNDIMLMANSNNTFNTLEGGSLGVMSQPMSL